VLVMNKHRVTGKFKEKKIVVPPGVADTTVSTNGRVYVKYNDYDFYPLYLMYYCRSPEYLNESKYFRSSINRHPAQQNHRAVQQQAQTQRDRERVQREREQWHVRQAQEQHARRQLEREQAVRQLEQEHARRQLEWEQARRQQALERARRQSAVLQAQQRPQEQPRRRQTENNNICLIL